MSHCCEMNMNIGHFLEECALGSHLCSIYNSTEEQLAVVVSYIKIGLERNEQCLYILDENSRSTIISALKKAGVHVDEALRSEALIFMTIKDTYLNTVCFDPSILIHFFEDFLKILKSKGFIALRVSVEMTWILNGDITQKSLVQFESELHHFFQNNDALLMCQYSMERFPSGLLAEMIHSHPLIVFADMVCRNSFHSPARSDHVKNATGENVNDLLISMSVREYLRRIGGFDS